MLNFKNLFKHIKTFFVLDGKSLIILFILSFVSGFIELFGIGLLLPILELGFGRANQDQLSQIFASMFRYFDYQPTLSSLLVLLICIFLLKGCAVFITKFWSSVVSINLKQKLQILLSEGLGDLSYNHYTTLKSGFLSNILIKEAPTFTQGFSEFVRIQTTFVYIVFYFVTSSVLRYDLTFILLGAGLLLFVPMRFLMGIVRKTSKELTQRSGVLNASFLELIDNFVYVKATGAIHRFKVMIKARALHMNFAEKKLVLLASFVHSINEPVAVIALAILVYTQVVVGGSAMSEVMILGLLIYRMVGHIMLLQGQWQRFNSTFGSIEIVENTLADFQRQKEIDGTFVVETVKEDIVFDGVSLAYGSKTIFDNVHLTILPNQTTGIVGPSGAGKTTLFYLLTGLIEVNGGHLRLGERDYKTLQKSGLRSKIGYVPQNPAMIDGTLLENINFGCYDSEHPMLRTYVQDALSQAGLGELKDDLDQPLGEKGVKVSGGQRQRIAIARELLRDTELLILDEATSALDGRSDQKVQKTIDALQGQKTIVIISHRLTSIKNCDQIHLLQEGELQASGTFEELLESNSEFQSLYNHSVS